MSRFWLAVTFLGVVGLTTGILEGVCGKSSQHCLSTWLHGANKDNHRVVHHEHGNNASRDCFDFDTWNETALGDTALALSSFFVATPITYISYDNVALVTISLYIAITSFLLHATYGEVSRMYDVLGIRMATFAIALDAVPITFRRAKDGSHIENIYISICKLCILLVIGYVAWFQWRILPAEWHSRLLDKPEFKNTSVTFYYNVVASPFVIIAIISQRLYNTRAFVITIASLALGSGLLWAFQDQDCPSHPQTLSAHSFGHLFIGIGLTGLAAVFNTIDSPYQKLTL